MNLMEQDKQYLLNVYPRIPLEIVKGEGMYLFDKDGRRYLDFFSGIAVNTLGHGHPEVMAAVSRQMAAYFHLSNYFVSQPQVDLARLLVENSFASGVFFANSGTEANEAMLKLARRYGVAKHKTKTNFVALHHGFHGRTTGALSLTANPAYRDPFGLLLSGVTHVDLNDSQALKEAVTKDTCGIIFEVLQGEGGLGAITPQFAQKIKALAAEHDALILLDEVQTGLMRTGKLFVHEHFDLVPDAMTLAKGLGGGLPIGALLVSEALRDVLKAGDHGSTFGGNPVAAAAGAAVLRVTLDPDFQSLVNDKGRYLLTGLQALQERFPDMITEIRGLGLMLGLEMGRFAIPLKDKALERGLLLNVTGKTVLRLLPALIVEQKDIDFFLVTTEKILKELQQNL